MGIFQLLLVLIFPTIFGFVGRYVAKQKGRSSMEGFLLGFFLSVFGLLIIVLLPTKSSDS